MPLKFNVFTGTFDIVADTGSAITSTEIFLTFGTQEVAFT